MLIIDEENNQVIDKRNGQERVLDLSSVEAFEAVSDAWIRAGWDAKYVYSFSWMGRPIIQLPEDMIRLQEVIWTEQPDLIIETGVAHGGSLIYYASLFHARGHGRIVGIDIEIRPHNRKAIEEHILFPYISLIEGSSIDSATVDEARGHIKPDDKVMVMLDSNHLKDHVSAELEAYAPMVSVGSYIVVMDGIMKRVKGAPRTEDDWDVNNPLTSIDEFLASHPEFEMVEPEFPFNEGIVRERITYWPNAYLKRVR